MGKGVILHGTLHYTKGAKIG